MLCYAKDIIKEKEMLYFPRPLLYIPSPLLLYRFFDLLWQCKRLFSHANEALLNLIHILKEAVIQLLMVTTAITPHEEVTSVILFYPSV